MGWTLKPKEEDGDKESENKIFSMTKNIHQTKQKQVIKLSFPCLQGCCLPGNNNNNNRKLSTELPPRK